MGHLTYDPTKILGVDKQADFCPYQLDELYGSKTDMPQGSVLWVFALSE